jgi:cellulose biosynthesis protein BcsQ
MKIAVISAADRCGATASTLLMAYAIAATQGRTVRICYTGANETLQRYTGRYVGERDATRTISQVSKLLEARAIAPEALDDYCVKIGTNIDIMDSWDQGLTEEEITSLLTFIFSRAVSDFIFCDIADAIEDPTSQEILKVCDVVVIVSEPSYASLESVRQMQESPAWPKDKTCMLLIAKYNDEISPVAKLAKQAQFKMRATCKIHYNPLITKYCSSGQLDTIIPYILQKDPRVVELNNDLKECVQFFLSISNAKIKWER